MSEQSSAPAGPALLPWPCAPHRFTPLTFGVVGRVDATVTDWCGYMPGGLRAGQVCGDLAGHPVHRAELGPACGLCGLVVARQPVPLGGSVWTHVDVDGSVRIAGHHAPRVLAASA